MSIERLDKVLSHEGFGTRKDVKRFIRSHEVLLNDKTVTDPSAHFDTEKDTLCVDGEFLELQKYVYLMMNKKANYVCANKDGLHETVFSTLEEKYRIGYNAEHLHLVGRLDIDTEGLLIFTTDGNFTHRLTSPKTHCAKTYFVRLRDEVDSEKFADYEKRLASGIHIDAEANEEACDCMSAELQRNLENPTSANEVFLTIYEGKYHQVKRMFSALGNEVVYLKRVSIGALKLDESIPLGTAREMTEDEIALLINL